MLQGLLGIFSGLITPVQTAVNTRLGRSIGSPLRASLVSFSVGLIAMLTLTLLLGPYPLIPAIAANGPWWMWFAGVFGVTFLTGNVLLLPKLGSLKTVIMPVTGQIVMCSAVQTALLGKLGVALGSPVKASLASFVVGLISLAIVVAFVDRTYSLGDALKKGNPWWMWAGGLLGATLVMCNAYLSAHIGTGMTVMLVLLGQVGGGLLVDRFGLLGVPRKPVAGIQYVGVLVAIVGIVLKAM